MERTGISLGCLHLVFRKSHLGAVCDHPPDSHLSSRGTRADSGEYLSRQTACYPDALALKFAKIICPLFSKKSKDWSWEHRHRFLPIKGLPDLLSVKNMVLGIFSSPDWSLPDREVSDSF